MNVFSASELFNQPFFILPEYAVNYYSAWQSYINGDKLRKSDFSQERELRTPVFVSAAGNTVSGWQHSKAEKDSVAVMRLKGPVLKDSQFCGPTGTMDYAGMFNQMADNPNIIGCVLRMESGGGAAYAVKPLADAMSSFPKPVLVLAEDVMASAAYYIASYADEIMADNPKSIIGSIGTMISFADIKPALEKKGVVFHEIYASQSTEKNKMHQEALDGNYKPIISKWLDPLNEDFINHVKTNRQGKIDTGKNTVFNGDTFFATEAKKLGMIDSMGTLPDAIARVREMAKSPKSIQHKNKIDTNMRFPKLIALAGKTEATQEELTAVNAELTEAGVTGFAIFPEAVVTDAAVVTAELETTKAGLVKSQVDLAQANTDLGTAKADLGIAQSEIVTLKDKLAKAPAAVAPKVGATETVAEPTLAEKAQATLDALPHNKALEGNPLFN